MPEGGVESFQAVFHRSFGEIYGYVAYRLAPIGMRLKMSLRMRSLPLGRRGTPTGGMEWSSRGFAVSPAAKWPTIFVPRSEDAIRRKQMGQRAWPPRAGLPRTNDRSCWPRRRGCCPQSTWNCSKKSTLRGFPFDKWQRSGALTEKSIESALSRARDMLRRTYHRLQTQEEVARMKTFDFDRDEQIASALAEAVKAYSPPPGLQETVGERLFGRTGDSVFTLGANPDLDGSGSADPQAARLAVRPAGRIVRRVARYAAGLAIAASSLILLAVWTNHENFGKRRLCRRASSHSAD